MPFAWETSPDEPLARARTFMGEVLSANTRFVAIGKEHFAPFVDGQHPRATVVACADSRVQANAWDSSPEDDDFTIRNIGNQIPNALGSVEYGIEHLHTPVLMIVGHTGCGAVKAVLEKTEGLAAPIAAELSQLKLPEGKPGAAPAKAWSDAVLANVNAQVATAVQHFAAFVNSGELTVVGAVYDFRNDLGGGHGRLHLVNVNTNVEPPRIEAFIKAVQSAEARSAAKGAAAAPKLSAVDERVRTILERAERALPKPRTPAAPAPNAAH